MAQFISAIIPPFTNEVTDAEGFFKAYLAFPIVLFFWVCGYAWKREGFVKLDDIDLDFGRREHDWDRIHKYRARVAAMPAWRRAFEAVF